MTGVAYRTTSADRFVLVSGDQTIHVSTATTPRWRAPYFRSGETVTVTGVFFTSPLGHRYCDADRVRVTR
jgi:hypothetical protein